LISSIGAFLLGGSFLIFLYNVAKSWRSGAIAGNDPWDGRTLEWTIPSPPPEYNFLRIPIVRARDPLWAEKHPEEGHGHGRAVPAPIAGGAPRGGESVDESTLAAAIHLPDPSIFPPIAALGLMLTMAGLLVGDPPPPPSWLSVIGLLTFLLGIFGWALEPVNG
jgi:cytochrome c oxidase subunit 1